MNLKQMLMLSIMVCLVNAKCSDNDDVNNNSNSTTLVNKIVATTSNNSTSTSHVNKITPTTSKYISNISTTNNTVDNKMTTPKCLCNSANRL